MRLSFLRLSLARRRPERAWTDPQHPASYSLRPTSPWAQAAVEAMFVLGLVCTVAFCWIAAREIVRHVAHIGDADRSLGHSLLVLLVAGVSLAFSLRWLLVQGLVVRYYARTTRERPPAVTHWPFVTILVPGFNEAPTIQATIRSLLAIDYPQFEILVIDDGSTDGMADAARAFEGRHGPAVCRVLSKPNGGKWSAHNFGLLHARGELILCVDADTTFEPNALQMLVRRMSDPTVGAVAGNGLVRNLEGLLPHCQGLEYIYSNAAFRLPQTYTGTVLCVPGPIGLFRRAALDQVHAHYGLLPPGSPKGHFAGPFQHDTFCEDFDLSVAMLAFGWRIVYEPRAICHTEVPTTLVGLISQRYRWTRGNLQVLMKFRRRYRPAQNLHGRTLWTWLISTYVIETSTGFLLNYLFLALTVLLLLGSASDARFLATYWSLNLLQRGLFSTIAILLHRERLRLLWAWPIYEFFSGLVLGGSLVIAVIDQLRGTAMGWGREHRPAG
ncbi:MAG TPA: glycosyltransferase [Gemmataceae bacterium]|jgi:cellulose synthase/poly-beta-1,6-N-acetylglucosamine synthase-like glycosyltransferase|nr:glycosyltransferase [Gemmataceae bacterium]